MTKEALTKSYERFAADARFSGGDEVTVFCPNASSLMCLIAPGIPVFPGTSIHEHFAQ